MEIKWNESSSQVQYLTVCPSSDVERERGGGKKDKQNSTNSTIGRFT